MCKSVVFSLIKATLIRKRVAYEPGQAGLQIYRTLYEVVNGGACNGRDVKNSGRRR